MDNHTLNEIYSTLSAVGIVDSKREFYKDWMNRSEAYDAAYEARIVSVAISRKKKLAIDAIANVVEGKFI